MHAVWQSAALVSSYTCQLLTVSTPEMVHLRHSLERVDGFKAVMEKQIDMARLNLEEL